MSKERLFELIDTFCKKENVLKFNKEILDKFADYLFADGWIRLPCKVGDEVYCLKKRWNPNKAMWEIFITDEEIALSNVDIVFITSQNDAFGEKAIGKTVFLTREEAEAKLKGDKIAIQ